jgi:endonuclease-3
LRQDRTAPVDTDGGEVLPEKSEDDPKTYNFQVLVALLLIIQTKDAVVGETMHALQQHGLSVDNIIATSPETLNALIGKVGFHNNKTKYLKQFVEILKDQYDGDIPPTADEMIDQLPGIGPKMAYIVENIVWKRCDGLVRVGPQSNLKVRFPNF